MDVPPALHVWCMPKVMATPTFSIHCTRMRAWPGDEATVYASASAYTMSLLQVPAMCIW